MPKALIRLPLVALVLLSAGCSKAADAPPPPVPAPAINDVLPNIPRPPDGTALTTESGADATQLTFVSPLSVDSIVNYYRKRLGESPFRLVSEARDGGSTVFMAEQDGPMLWVTVKSDSAGGSAVTIAGGADLSKKKPVQE